VTSTSSAARSERTTIDLAEDQPRFRDLGVPRKLAEVLRQQGIHRAFPIQAASLPASLAGDDLSGRAPTGSGKTLAFAIPVVENTPGDSRPHHPGALLLAPTRELANQIHDTILPLAKARGKWVASFYGGTNVKRDVARLRKGVDIVVGTPGRLEDLIQQRELHLDDVRVVVIDEADRMADMGFLPVVKRLIDQTHRDRQTLLFSATLDGDVDVLVRRYQRDPVRVEIDESEEEQGDVTHLFWSVDRQQRRQLTHEVLDRSGQTIVFTRTKRGADRLSKQLNKQGLRTTAIHGNRSQNQRERALAEFAGGEVTALIATDVAARGIHVDEVDTVLHYDLPATDKDYVHRSGRTGRAGRDGVVLSLVCEDQHGDLRSLQRGLEVGSGTHDIELDHVTTGATTRTARPAQAGNDQRSRTRSESRSQDGNGDGQRNRTRGQGGTGQQRSSSSRRTSGGARPRSRRRANR
jgi:superfamily II DNA/RNA helicase